MYHLPTCPKCKNQFLFSCENENKRDPFEDIHFDNIVRLLYPNDQYQQRVVLEKCTESQLKLMFLLHILGHDLPEFEDLAELPAEIETFIDKANEKQTEHMLIQLLGQWDELGEAHPKKVEIDEEVLRMGARLVCSLAAKRM